MKLLMNEMYTNFFTLDTAATHSNRRILALFITGILIIANRSAADVYDPAYDIDYSGWNTSELPGWNPIREFHFDTKVPTGNDQYGPLPGYSVSGVRQLIFATRDIFIPGATPEIIDPDGPGGNDPTYELPSGCKSFVGIGGGQLAVTRAAFEAGLLTEWDGTTRLFDTFLGSPSSPAGYRVEKGSGAGFATLVNMKDGSVSLPGGIPDYLHFPAPVLYDEYAQSIPDDRGRLSSRPYASVWLNMYDSFLATHPGDANVAFVIYFEDLVGVSYGSYNDITEPLLPYGNALTAFPNFGNLTSFTSAELGGRLYGISPPFVAYSTKQNLLAVMQGNQQLPGVLETLIPIDLDVNEDGVTSLQFDIGFRPTDSFVKVYLEDRLLGTISSTALQTLGSDLSTITLPISGDLLQSLGGSATLRFEVVSNDSEFGFAMLDNIMIDGILVVNGDFQKVLSGGTLFGFGDFPRVPEQGWGNSANVETFVVVPELGSLTLISIGLSVFCIRKTILWI